MLTSEPGRVYRVGGYPGYGVLGVRVLGYWATGYWVLASLATGSWPH